LQAKYIQIVRAYLLAAACVALASSAEALSDRLIGGFVSFGFFYPAILVSALLGIGPGIFAMVISLLVAWFFFLPPVFSFAFETAKETRELVLFAICASLIITVARAYRRAQSSRNAANRLFKTVQDMSTEGVVLYRALRDEAGRVVDLEYEYANPAAIGFMSGSDPKRVIGARLLERLPMAREHPLLFPRYLKVLETGKSSEAEYELGGRWFHSNVAKLEDGLVVTVRDVSATHRSDEVQRLLAQELNHRVKNMLATVISMTSFTGKGASSATELKEKLLGRFQAMGRVHGLLVASSWTDASVGAVVHDTLDPYLQSDSQRFVIDGPEITITPETALALNMALHELATNAIKYGALSAQHGEIGICWALDAERPSLVHLTWRETGGPPISSSISQGFGTRLLEKVFAGSEGGAVKLDFAKDGAICEMCFGAKPAGTEHLSPKSQVTMMPPAVSSAHPRPWSGVKERPPTEAGAAYRVSSPTP
jgi:two-component sensor histidine kinase